MPYKFSTKQLNGIKTQLELEVPFETIAKSTPCSYAMVMEVRKNLQVWGTPRPPKLIPTDPRRVIMPDIKQLTLDPTLYLDEIALYIKKKYTLDVSTATISRCLKAKKFSKKVLAKCSFLMNLLSMSICSSDERAGRLEVLLFNKHSRSNGLSARASYYAMAVESSSVMISYMAVLRKLYIMHSSWSKFYYDVIHFRAQTVSYAWIMPESIAQRN
ncbi:MAG: hypothetical protein M1840_006650 [Geoglossum simile]|nr:MAG: hypothetical protein M1840_006650 [Geoglossum simile]